MDIRQVKISDIQEGPIRHQTLSDTFVQRVKDFKQALSEVELTPLENTLENFQRDMHPERELKIWERMASTYQWTIIANPGLSLLEKKDVLGVLLGISVGSKDFSHIKNLSKDKVDAIVNHYS